MNAVPFSYLLSRLQPDYPLGEPSTDNSTSQTSSSSSSLPPATPLSPAGAALFKWKVGAPIARVGALEPMP